MLAAGETAALLADFRYIAAMMMDTAYYRFDLTTFPDEKGGKRSNWNADRATGLGVMRSSSARGRKRSIPGACPLRDRLAARGSG